MECTTKPRPAHRDRGAVEMAKAVVAANTPIRASVGQVQVDGSITSVATKRPAKGISAPPNPFAVLAKNAKEDGPYPHAGEEEDEEPSVVAAA
jgi:hypothetical protein